MIQSFFFFLPLMGSLFNIFSMMFPNLNYGATRSFISKKRGGILQYLKSKSMHDIRVRHLQVVECVLQYFRVILERRLLFKRSRIPTILTYTDVDYAGSVSDIRSTSCYCTFLYGNLVAWRSNK